MCKKYPAAEIKVLAGPLSSVLCSFQLLVAAGDPWLVLCPSSPRASILRSLSLLCVHVPASVCLVSLCLPFLWMLVIGFRDAVMQGNLFISRSLS